MRLRVLGCHGGESPTHRTTCFLVDDTLALDAGALTRGLTTAEQARVDNVVLSHAHLDHIRDLPLAADNVIGVRKKPLDIYAADFTATALEKHLFNDVIWPNFTKIPNPSDPEGRPTLRIKRFKPGEPFQIGDLTIRTVPVNHPVDCQAIFVHSKRGTLVYSGDTGPTDKLWEELNKVEDLRAFIFEVSFPNHMTKLAEVSGHLTPAMMAAELKKFRPQSDAAVLLYHLKPTFFDVLKAQVADLADPRLTVLRPMDEFDF
ncbi:MAG: 3',5'-cyclic-nucleotide phosphodiesterase [Deltaproteobacteria bacterium]|nr:3',5'-cyclic-nucleotide phosphodiesterase [Deltaproteobacteria bacterium]